MTPSVRPAAVAGTFYPGSRDELATLLDRLLAAAPAGPRPKALVVPHAGYIYSGPIAASGFARIAGAPIERVVVIGPAHRAHVDGLAWTGTTHLRTPLGDVAVDVDAIARVPELVPHAAAHAREHSIEVELPFVQRLAPGARIIPVVVGRAAPEQVGRVLAELWGGPETLVVISSDLSHYLPYDAGRARDRRTAEKIVALEPGLEGDEACGAVALDGLAWVARRTRLRVELVDLRSSGDTAGKDRDEVVGYGAFAVYEGS